MKNHTRFAALALAVSFAGLCFAPIEGMPQGETFHPELNDQQLGQYQGGNAAASHDPMTSPSHEDGGQVPAGSAEAAKNLAQAQGNAEMAAKSLAQAEKDQKSKSGSGGPNLALAGAFVLIGLACAVGFKTYMDKTVPEAPGRKK